MDYSLPGSSVHGISQLRILEWVAIPVCLPGESHGQRSLVGLQSMGVKESDTTEQINNNDMELS